MIEVKKVEEGKQEGKRETQSSQVLRLSRPAEAGLLDERLPSRQAETYLNADVYTAEIRDFDVVGFGGEHHT